MDVERRQRLGALRAGDAHAALRDLDAQVLAKTVGAGAVGAGGELREVTARLAEQAQRTLLQMLIQQLLLAGGGQGQDAGRLQAGQARCDTIRSLTLSCEGRSSTSSFFSFSSREP